MFKWPDQNREPRVSLDPDANYIIPLDRVTQLQSNSELLEALRILDSAGVNQAPVVDGKQITGVLSKDQVMHYIPLRTDLGF